VDLLFLIAYGALPLVTLWRTRSFAWTIIALVASISLFGGVVSFSIDHVTPWTRLGLQWTLLLALLVPAVVAFIRCPAPDAPRRYQAMTLVVPVVALTVLFGVITTWWTEAPAVTRPVSFLMGHAMAEDNAKWLDFAAGLASGGPMEQFVPMGGPLQLVLVFVATLMGVASSVLYGGYNEVLVAANTVIFGQYMLVVLAPLSLAPLIGVKLRRPSAAGKGWVRIPWPLIWLGALIVVMANLMLTAYGHLTLQYTILICILWVTTYLVWSPVPRARLWTSMAVVVGLTVWLPLNAIAAVVAFGWLVHVIVRMVLHDNVRSRLIDLGVVLVVIVMVWQPLYSSVAFTFGLSSAGGPVGGMGGGLHAVAAVSVPVLGAVFAGLADSTLFSAGGGTEMTTPLLAILAVVAVIASAVVVSRQKVGRQSYYRFIPVLLLAGFAMALNALDQWVTGSAPHYGSYKFTFMVIIVLTTSALPIGALMLDPQSDRMTLPRWAVVGGVLMVLIVDSLLVRSIAAARPDQWSPPIPFDNPRSYWWPAEVNGTADQPISRNPVGCVYLPQGAAAPSGILDSQLSDPQRVYSCTRLLAGLSGQDGEAQPIVDWLRREWLTNTRSWDTVHGYLEGMPDEVLDRPMILLDDGSNVIGLEPVRSLLNRYPVTQGG